jgi:hypothetical protein
MTEPSMLGTQHENLRALPVHQVCAAIVEQDRAPASCIRCVPPRGLPFIWQHQASPHSCRERAALMQ